jgi:hypothetical protein
MQEASTSKRESYDFEYFFIDIPIYIIMRTTGNEESETLRKIMRYLKIYFCKTMA